MNRFSFYRWFYGASSFFNTKILVDLVDLITLVEITELAVACLIDIMCLEVLQNWGVILNPSRVGIEEVPISIRSTRVAESISIEEIRIEEKIDIRGSSSASSKSIKEEV